MTQTHAYAHWIGPPSLSHHWMAALLLMLAMLWSSLARLFEMRLSRLAGECHTDVTPEALPQQDCEPIKKDPDQVARNRSQPTPALMLSRTRSVRPSKHEGVLTALSDKPIETHQDCLALPPLIPANAGTQGGLQGLFRLAAATAPSREDRLDLASKRARIRGHIAPI